MITNNHSIINTLLIDFEAIVDYKIGIINLFKKLHAKNINEEYIYKHDTNFFKIDHIYSIEDIIKKSLSEDVRDNYETLTNEILYGEYESDIYVLSVPTVVANLVRTYYQTGGTVKTDILCYTEKQKLFIEKALPGVSIIVSNRENVDIGPYGRIILGYTKSLKDFKDPVMKDFLIVNFRENFEIEDEAILKAEYTLPIMDLNKIGIIDSYNDFEKPV